MDDDHRSFRVDLRLLLELGERLISRDEVAVVELVKNAYDADAKSVEVIVEHDRIEVKDDGIGMNRDDIVEGWLTVGTTLKKRMTKTKLGRRVLGEKGLGRLAVLRLGKVVVVHTQKRKNACFRILMNWEKARNELDANQYTPLSEMKVDVEEMEHGLPLPFPEGHGTIITVERLNADWNENKIDRLKVFLSRLVEPGIGNEKEFAIRFFSNGERVEIEPPVATQTSHYSMEAKIGDDGSFFGRMSWEMERGEGTEPIKGNALKIARRPHREKEEQESPKGIGGFKFKLFVWDLDAKEMRGYKDSLRQWAGISLYRDGFRVVQPDVDWLGLGLRRVQNPTLRLSTNQVIGSVFISSDGNPDLIDKTDREGIIESESFSILKNMIYNLMDILERKRYGLRRTEVITPLRIFNYLDTTPLRVLAKTLPQEERKELRGFASKLDRFRGMLGDWMLGRDRMATIGILGSKLLHTARSALMKINDNYPLIEKDQSKFEQPLRDRLGRMVEGGKMLNEIFKTLDPFLRFTNKKKQTIILREVMDSLYFIFEPEFKNANIKVRGDISEKIVFEANPTDLYVIFSNILDNAVYWLKASENKEKIIEVRASQNEEHLTVEIADSGPGIEHDIVNLIFDPGFTTKPNGTGLGLSIVRDAVELYGGRVEASNDETLKGALFKVVFPVGTS